MPHTEIGGGMILSVTNSYGMPAFAGMTLKFYIPVNIKGVMPAKAGIP